MTSPATCRHQFTTFPIAAITQMCDFSEEPGYHGLREAQYRCTLCGRTVCEQCMLDYSQGKSQVYG